MPVLFKEKVYPTGYAGGILDLNALRKLSINVTIRFPYTANGNSYDLKPLTVNLLTDIGLSPDAHAYVVKWGDNRPETDTISNSMSPFKHEHTYEPGNQPTKTMTYTIEVYGDTFPKYWPFDKNVGTEPNGFSIHAVSTGLSVLTKGFLQRVYRDRSIRDGARISRGWFGTKLFYQRDVRGSLTMFDIILDGSDKEVRLVNPLVKDMNNWENTRTDMVIDWGDGSKTHFYDKKVNTMLFNSSSKWIPNHVYKAGTGSRFTIKVKSVEPVVPIGCKIDSLYGTFPEDCYIGNKKGLFNYVEEEVNEWRTKIQKHKSEIRFVGSSLLDKWKNTTNMDYMFKDWVNLTTIPDYFFKENILSICTSYKETFRGNTNLVMCDEYLLGETNDVVINTEYMFADSSITETIKLKNASKLQSVKGMYNNSKVKDCYEFLENTPQLIDISYLFNDTQLKNYTNKLLSNSPKITTALHVFSNSKIGNILINMKQWRNIQDIQFGFAYTPLVSIENDTFGGDFGIGVVNNTIRMTSIFEGIGTDDVYTDIKSNVFKALSKISKKLYSSQCCWLKRAKIQKLHDGMFDDVFRHWVDYNESNPTSARFVLEGMFTGIKTKDNFGYKEPCIKIPRMFRNGFGILSILDFFSKTFIGYIDEMVIQDMVNLEIARGLLVWTSLYTKIPNEIFRGLRHIKDLYASFYLTDYKYVDTPLDRILYVEGNHELDCRDMFGGLRLRVYRLFNKDSNFTGTIKVFEDLIEGQSLPQSVIINGVRSNIKDPNKFTIRPLIIHCVATENTTVTLSNGTKADISVDGVKSSVTLPHDLTLTKGNHTIEVVSTTAVVADGNDFYVTALDGEYPYNSTIPDYPSCYTLREIGQFVYAVCDADSVHSKNRLMYIPIMHKNIFNYHDKVTRTNFMSTDDNIMKSSYGLQPRIYQHMYGLETFDNMFNTSIPVISDIALPQLGKDISANLISETSKECVTTNIHAGNLIYNGNLTSLSFGKAQINTPKGAINPAKRKKEEYLEMRLEGSNTPLQLVKLIGEPTLPITVETISKGQLKPVKHVINAFSDTINITGDFFIRIYSDKPVWINNKTAITELYGVIPPCEFTPHFINIAPNLRRVGANIFIRCTNRGFTNTFKGLQKFEYFPGTLFWYNYNAVDYESCFADCPKLFKVDDYIITDKIGDINCRNMFANSGVQNVRRPIADDIMGKVDISGMFTGCLTRYFYGESDIDKRMFYNVDIFGRSGIKFSGDNSVYANLDNRYVCLDPSSSDMDITYFIPDTILHSNNVRWDSLNYASQAIANQILDVDNSHLDPSKHITRYLPFLVGFDPYSANNANGIPEDYYSYCEFIKYPGTIQFTTPREFPKLALWRNNDIVTISGAYQNSKFTNTNIADTLPFDCRSMFECDLAYAGASGITVNNDYKIPHHIIKTANEMFKNSTINVCNGIFDDKDVGGMVFEKTIITEMFKGNMSQKNECGVFRSFGSYLHPSLNTGVYHNSGLATLTPDKVYEGCEHLEVLDYHFSNCPDLSTLPKINHLTNVWSYQHMFERSNILDIPANYLYTTRNDKDIMLDYMFANCPELFFTEVWIDGRCPGYFSIDYSLNEVFSGIGDDPEIFGHIRYDAEYEHRSRVYPFDTRVTWIQIVEVLQPNTTVKLEGLYNKNLVGFDPEQIFAVMWGDTKQATVVRDGYLLEEQHVTHTYTTPGTYELRVMLRNDCCYLPTLESGETKIKTVDLPTSFKFGSVTDIRDKGLYNMFGTGVRHVSRDLFTKLTGIESIQVYNNMFTKFKNLTDLEVGVLDCVPNLTTMKDFLYDSKGTEELTLKVGLLDKLTKLTDIENFAFRSNVRTVEPHLFDKNTVLDSILYGFTESKVTELPRDLLSKLTALNNVGRLVAWCSNFVLDESYSNFFTNNSNIEWASGVFMGVKINAIPTNIMKPLVKAVTVAEMFATDQQLVSSEPWTDGKLDTNDLHIPSGFLSANTKLQETANMFAGRKSLKDYPANLLSTNKALNNTRCMFMQTGISRIHEGTFNGFTTNIDAQYMFYGCRVRLCPKPIVNSTGTFKTLGMLYRVSGLMTEDELFAGVKTDPADIQSMYRQELEYYVMDGTFSGNMHLKAIEPSTFPWDGYTLDIDPGDGNVITIETDIPNQDKLTELTRFTPKGSTIKVKTPFAIELAGGTATYTRLSGVFGRMATTTHILMKNTGYQSSKFTIDDDNFYKRNTHLTSLAEAFESTNVEYIRTNTFKHLTRVTTINNMCYGDTQFKIKSGYTPNFDHMKLTEISQAFEACSGLVINKDWEPFKNIPTIVKAVNVFARSGIITTPYVNTTSLTEAQGMYWTCPNLTTTYVDILNGASKCWNYYGVFGNSPKLSIIEGESDTHSIGDTAITGVTGSVDYKHMFTNTGLSQQQIVRIVNNLGVWKVNTQLTVNTTNMFTDMLSVGSSGAKPGIKINTTNKNIDAERMFYNARLTNVPNQAVVLTGNSSLNYNSMFYNCFADPSVEILNDVFNIPGQTSETDFRSSELDTLNVFRISVTPEQVANVMSSSEISTASIVDDIAEIPTSDNNVNISDNIISDNIDEKQINSTNVSTNIIVDNIEEEI